MRTLTGHVVNPANDKIKIEVADEPGAGGANHRYVISGFDTSTNKSADSLCNDQTAVTLLFQNGAIPETGVNGVTQEVLLELVADRLRSFQAGPFACRENAIALTKIEEAQMWLLQRTRKRMQRGVEGTHAV